MDNDVYVVEEQESSRFDGSHVVGVYAGLALAKLAAEARVPEPILRWTPDNPARVWYAHHVDALPGAEAQFTIRQLSIVR